MNYALKAERDLWGALDGPWDGPDYANHRRNWSAQVICGDCAAELIIASSCASNIRVPRLVMMHCSGTNFDHVMISCRSAMPRA